jgi:3-hydroxyisobutyrate dehydrogenase-like beta-hydroxyacid dehydrogenase
MIEHDYTPLFKLAHMLKDVQLCLAEARTAGSAFPFAGLAAELYGAGVGRGLGDEDFASIVEVVESITGARL